MESKPTVDLHPSGSSPSLKITGSRPESICSTRSKGGSRHHALLKSDQSIQKEVPIPPTLTPGPSQPTGRDITMKHRYSTISVPTRRSSMNNLMAQDQGIPIVDEAKRPGVVCIDPALHPPGTHTRIHHPGLVSGADFCDAGVPTERDSPIRTPPSRLSLADPAETILTGRIHRVLTGGDLCEEIVDVSDHIHRDHSSAVKVRPAVGLFYGGDEKHEGHGNISRVQPAINETEDKEDIHKRITPKRAFSTPVKPYALERFHHGHNLAPKVRQSLGSSAFQNPGQALYPSDIHEGHGRVEKVQPHHETTYLGSDTKEDSYPELAAQTQGDQPQKNEALGARSYWGFIPRFGEKWNDPMDHPTTHTCRGEAHGSRSGAEDKSTSMSHVENHPSLSASQYSASQKSFDIISKAVARITESMANQENVPHDNKSTTSLRMPVNASPPEEKPLLRDNRKEDEISTTSVSPTSHPRSPNRMDELKQDTMPEKIDPRRAATWLRQLLGYPEPQSSKFTQLPEKSHPRHEDHHDYHIDKINMLASRVTTFSRENAADAGAMNTAMRNLERLLSEALLIADEVTERDLCGRTDDRNPSSHSISSEVIHRALNPPSGHESARSKLGDDVDRPILATTPPNIFVGAVEGFGHGCDALSSIPAQNPGSIEPDMHSGNIRGPPYPEIRRNAYGLRKLEQQHTASREICHDVPSDDGVLPMPPAGNQLKRQCLSPLAHAYDEDDLTGIVKPRTTGVPNSREVREYIRVFHQPPIRPRSSSRNLREASRQGNTQYRRSGTFSETRYKDMDVRSLDGGTSDDIIDFSTQYSYNDRQGTEPSRVGGNTRIHNQNIATANTGMSQRQPPPKRAHEVRNVNLRRRSHVSIRDGQRFSLSKSVKRQPTIARDWSPIRKRFVASVACISTALIGVLAGIYAGLVPSVQYYIADFHHYSIIGNVGLYLGMALSTFFCWPLPLLHGRKPYIVCSLCVAMPLLFPQAIAVSSPRSPYTSVWRWALLLPRAIMGCALGLASMNFHSVLTDLFGASLMSSNPHQEVVDHLDVRRHGGGLGVWLGVWTWCFIGSLGIGFLIGAVVIDSLRPSWGLYISIMLIAVVLLLNVLCPEVRRSAWRRSVAEVRTSTGVSRRLARGEVMMHRVKDGPKWWGQEMYHGVALSLEMLRQPGFIIMAVYSAWIYAQVVLIIVLLGSLSSRHYHIRSPFVGAAVSSIAIGALAAVPFQKANLFSRSRSTGPLTNSMTFDKSVTWTSHLVRRAIFILVLPIAGILYTIVSSGPPVHVVFPCIFAAMIGFLSCLAIAECNGILMEAWDCSDLQPGMTGRSKSGSDGRKRTNYSSFPRVMAGWNTIHSIGFIFAAGATGIGGIATRSLGQRAATGVVASILFLQSVLLLAALARFRQVQIIPNSKSSEMDRWTEERRDSLRRRASAIAAAKANGLKNVSEIPEDDVG
ncbi:hypothetical protein AAE478_006506 [Parahypoxylon ruwenzoriense]